MRLHILILAMLSACAQSQSSPVEGTTSQQARCEDCDQGDDGGDWIDIDPTSPEAQPAVQAVDDFTADGSKTLVGYSCKHDIQTAGLFEVACCAFNGVPHGSCTHWEQIGCCTLLFDDYLGVIRTRCQLMITDGGVTCP